VHERAPEKIVTPIAAPRSPRKARRSLDPPRSAPAAAFVFRNEETKMIALYDHIQQLRAELANNGDAGEIRTIEGELKAAEAEQALHAAEFASWFETER
jgi:hypothetical protein